MINIRTTNLPIMEEECLLELHSAIVSALAKIPESGISGEADMLDIFPKDHMEYGLGTEIYVEILEIDPELSKASRDLIAAAVGHVIEKFLPECRNVECTTKERNPREGYYKSTRIH